MVLTGFFDNLMVGQLGHEDLAAAGICNSVFFLIAVFPMGLTIAFSTIIGLLNGKNYRLSAIVFFRDAFWSTAFISALGFGVLMFCAFNFSWFKQEPEVALLSVSYLKLLTWSFVPMLFFFMFKHIADGYSYTKAGMIVTISALILNIFLNWVFIYGNLGFNAYGLDGAGYATLISRIYLLVAMVIFFFKSSKIPIDYQSIKKYWNRFKHLPFVRQIKDLGVPTGFQYFFEIAAFVFAALMAGWISSEALAAHQLAITLAALTYMFSSGISAGASICVANNYGNKALKEVRKYGVAAHQMGTAITLVFAVLFVVERYYLASLFADNPEVVETGAYLLLFAGVFQLVDGLQAISLGLLRGVEDTKKPSMLIFASYWLVSMPLAYFLAFKFESSIFALQGINAIWAGLTFGLFLASLFLTTRFYTLLRASK